MGGLLREAFCALAGAVVAIVAFFAVLTAMLVPAGLDDGPGLVVGMMILFGMVPLFLIALAARGLVLLLSRSGVWWVVAAVGSVLAATAFHLFVSHMGYGALLGLPVLMAGLIAGALAGGLSTVLSLRFRRRA